MLREENYGLDGICAFCSTEQIPKLQDFREMRNVYSKWECTNCQYEHIIFKRKI